MDQSQNTIETSQPAPPYVPIDDLSHDREECVTITKSLTTQLEDFNIKSESRIKEVMKTIAFFFVFFSFMSTFAVFVLSTNIREIEDDIDHRINLKLEENTILLMRAIERINDMQNSGIPIETFKKPCLLFDEDKQIATFAKYGECVMQPPRYGIEPCWSPCYMKVGKGRYDYADEGDCEFYF